MYLTGDSIIRSEHYMCWGNVGMEGAYMHLHACLCLRNSISEPAPQEAAALSGRELQAQSQEHCEYNVYYAILAT